MGLKQSIVVVNEFTYKTGSNQGTRGSSPKNYVMGYMARGDAVEDVVLSQLHTEDSLQRKYEVREQIASTSESIPEMRHRMRTAQHKGGVAFGNNSAAMSHDALVESANYMQQQFDAGKTIFKTVLSFDENWLKEHGLIDDDFEMKRRGDMRGKVDQLKLRLAVMNGIKKMSRNFDDLHFVGCIQVDTKHLHVHLAMVDAGRGRVRYDGLQRGKLTANDKKILRRGIDDYLDRKQKVKALSTAVARDKQNAMCYVKRFAHKTIAKQGLPQFLIACLPEDRRLWRASTNRKEMHRANAIVREYVIDILQEPGSGYLEAMQDVMRYAGHRRKRENLSSAEYDKLVRHGQKQIMDRCVNAVYSVLKQIPQKELVVHTPMIDVMAMDYEEMADQAANDPLVEFGFRLRSYSSRLHHHRDEYHKFRDEYRNYESTIDKSNDSKPLGDYLKVEQNYNAMLMVKYQYFLSFLPVDEGIEDEFDALMKEKEELQDLRNMQKDPAFQKLSSEAAYDYGVKVYHQRGGDKIKAMPLTIQRRIERFEASVSKHEMDFRDKLHDYGMDYDGHGVTRKKMYPFDMVKALDLHHLGYDFPYDYRISMVNAQAFVRMANLRYHSFLGAKDYLVRSGQEEAVKVLPEQDVLFMKEYADSLQIDSTVSTAVRPKTGTVKKRMTVQLGTDYGVEMEQVVKSTVQAVQMDSL